MFFANRICYELPDEGRGGGGGASQQAAQGQQPPQNSQQGQQADSGQDNPTGFDLNGSNIWSAGNNNAQQQSAQGQQQQSAQQPQQGQDLSGFESYVKGLQFAPAVNGELAQRIQQGDPVALQEYIGGIGQQIYKQAMLDATRLFSGMQGRIVDDAVNKASTLYGRDKAVTALQSQIPIAKNPNIAPIAQGVFAQFMKSGASQEQAIENTRQFLASMGNVDHKQLGMNSPPRSSNGQGRGSPAGRVSDDELVDWLSFARE